MEQLDGILKIVGNELDAINKNGKFRSREEIDSVGKLVDIVKDVHCIWEYEDESGMSYDDGMSYRGSYRDRMTPRYDDGNSYARRQRRDSMGRYSRERGYSRADKTEYVEQLREMMMSAPDDATRQSIQRMIQQMEA